MSEATTSSDNKTCVSNADRVACALEELGTTCVKFGQAIASRPGIIPKSLAASFSDSQDGMKTLDSNVAKNVIIKDLRL